MSFKIFFLSATFLFMLFSVKPKKEVLVFNTKDNVDYLGMLDNYKDSLDKDLHNLTISKSCELVVVKKENKKLKRKISEMRNFSANYYKNDSTK